MRTRLSLVALALSLLGGLILGIGVFTFGYAEGWSYLSDDPQACVNCHIMNPQFASWVKSSHGPVATCNDCHLPHSFAGKWLAKARNGFNHSLAFTLENFPEPIRITPVNAQILQGSCLECHQGFVHPLLEAAPGGEQSIRCVHCHFDVGHGPRAGLGR